MRLKHLLPLTAAALVAAPAAAPAAPPAAGVVEHRVYEVREASPPPGRAAFHRAEHFVARDRDRSVLFDASGAITDETAKSGSILRAWNREDNVLTISPHGVAGVNFVLSRATEGANTARLIGDGTYRTIGETTWNGRAALTLAVNAPDRAGHAITHVVDRATKQMLETTEVNQAGTVTFSRKLVSDEDLPLNAETEAMLQMSPHPGAAVKGSASKSRKAAKRKAKQRRAAKAKRR